MRGHILPIMAACLFGLGCVGEMVTGPGGAPGDDASDDGGGNARELFDELNPQQLIECGACHVGTNLDDTEAGPDYLGAGAEASYETIMAYRSYQNGGPLVGNSPENSKLYVYGAHAGPALSAGLAEKIAAWIEAEAGVVDPGGDGAEDPPPSGGGPATQVEALELFANCMTYSDFQTTQFATVADESTPEGRCYSCHGVGTGGAFLAEDDIEFYTNQRRMPYILKFVLGTVNEDGSFKDLVIAGRYQAKQSDGGHPNYILEATRVQAVQQFFDLTYARYEESIASGTPCAPDTPVEVPPAPSR
jgi:mono/diheme cytochrome c family protein